MRVLARRLGSMRRAGSRRAAPCEAGQSRWETAILKRKRDEPRGVLSIAGLRASVVAFRHVR
jgi:hypothetical protein